MSEHLDTELVIEGVVIPLRSAVEYTENWEVVGDYTDYHSWDGEAEVVGPTFGTKYRINLQAAGQGVWRMPALMRLKPNDLVTLHSKVIQTDYIPIGADQCILLRDPVPGSVFVRDLETDEQVPFELDGRTVIVDGATDRTLIVPHRWIFECKYLRPPEPTVNGRTGELTWGVGFVEKSAP
jgi:hypothetical protein